MPLREDHAAGEDIMTRRPNLSQQVAILQEQALCGCGCGRSLKGRKIAFHHWDEYALGGATAVRNISALIDEDVDGYQGCHDRHTNGPRGATSAGSSKNKVAKVRRKAKKLERAVAALIEAERRMDVETVMRITIDPPPPMGTTIGFQHVVTPQTGEGRDMLDRLKRSRWPKGRKLRSRKFHRREKP
jgi:hypothetical protein